MLRYFQGIKIQINMRFWGLVSLQPEIDSNAVRGLDSHHNARLLVALMVEHMLRSIVRDRLLLGMLLDGRFRHPSMS